MAATDPDIANLGYCAKLTRPAHPGLRIVVFFEQESVDFKRIKAGEREVIIQSFQFADLQCDHLEIELGPGGRAVDGEPEGAGLGVIPVVTNDDRNIVPTEDSCGFHTQVSVYDFAGASDEDGDPAAVLA